MRSWVLENLANLIFPFLSKCWNALANPEQPRQNNKMECNEMVRKIQLRASNDRVVNNIYLPTRGAAYVNTRIVFTLENIGLVAA